MSAVRRSYRISAANAAHARLGAVQGARNIDHMHLITLEKRWKHHASGSGYDRLADYLNGVRVTRPDLSSAVGKLASKAWEHFGAEHGGLFDYGLGDRIAEERVFWRALGGRADIVHALYGDEQLDLLLRRAPLLRSKLVATFHLPSERTRDRFERVQPKELSRLSGAIVVASHEVAHFAQWLGADKVLYVPHGIDTDAFMPGPGNPGQTLKLLFVGLHMRDFEVAHRVADRCAAAGVDVVFDVVLPAARHGFFTGCDLVRRHSGISDAQLLALYQAADALFLPVTGATANNAVLEALACGTPVISTLIGGMPDYVDASCGWLLPPGDADAAFDCVQTLAANRDLARARRAGARARAEAMSWRQVAGQIQAAYARLDAGQAFAG
jgi:glycosyltransferase involved in cell wall biosynthesis